jgi:hypothetical protein
VTALGLLDFARAAVAAVDDRYGRAAAWAVAIAFAAGIPIVAVAIAIWWFLG